jgi:anti-sigma factor RsiW
MSEVTKEVILDLLPLYLAGEVSAETSALVKKYLEADPELAETAKEMAKADSLGKVPLPFKREAALETYQEAKKWMTIRTLGIALIAGIVLMCFFLALAANSIIESLTHFFTP